MESSNAESSLSESERRDLVRAFIKEIRIHKKKTADGWIKDVMFNFEVVLDGEKFEFSEDETFQNKATTDETVVQLSKGNISTQNVRVEFSLEDMDMSGFQQGATYEQIQEWIQEKYGFHVTHLNIAKTKRKCGIIERQNYNLAKSENSRSPDTPKEKEEAIIDAFLFFKMM